jgi:hypothetical protein
MNIVRRLLSASIAILLVAVAAAPSPTGEGGHANGGFNLFGTSWDSKLYRLDQNTANATLVADYATPQRSLSPGLAYDSRNGFLYSLGAINANPCLLRINLRTKAMNVVGFGAAGTCLAYDHFTDSLYTIGRDVVESGNGANLSAINPHTGHQTRIVAITNGLTKPEGWLITSA